MSLSPRRDSDSLNNESTYASAESSPTSPERTLEAARGQSSRGDNSNTAAIESNVKVCTSQLKGNSEDAPQHLIATNGGCEIRLDDDGESQSPGPNSKRHNSTHSPQNSSTQSASQQARQSANSSQKSLNLQNSSSQNLSPQSGASKRSSSDGAMRAMEEPAGPPGGSSSLQRCRSDCDQRVAATKARMSEKFDQLERESGIKLRRERRDTEASESEDSEAAAEQFRRTRSISVAEVKEQAYLRLEAELKRAQDELKLKDVEVSKLSRIRDQVEAELEDLTASLFEEANNMVRDANLKRMRCQKELHEANLKIDVLLAEVQALKMLVLTSTPSAPNPHLHPHIVQRNGVKSILSPHAPAAPSPAASNSNSLPKKSPSNYELGGTPPASPARTHCSDLYPIHDSGRSQVTSDDDCPGEVDPLFHEEFLAWRKRPNLDPIESSFIKRIYDEEIYPVFNFHNKDLMSRVLRAIEDNSIIIEAVSDKAAFPKRCALLDAPRACKYRMKLDDQWFNISQLCRNRIISVCDFFCYLRYIKDGLVKSSFHEVYWEIMRRRRNIALSRLGFSCT